MGICIVGLTEELIEVKPDTPVDDDDKKKVEADIILD